MDEKLLARERLLKARELVMSVMTELDTSTVNCPCPDHVKHYANWSDAQTHIRLQALVDRLDREAHNESVTALTHREAKAQGWTNQVAPSAT